MPTFEQHADEYRERWAKMTVRPDWEHRASADAQRIIDARRHYEPVSGATGVPWHIIGIIHQMECGGSFRGHLHNGDPLTARTRQVPRGRPVAGSPPFTWEDSAIDAIRYDELDKVADWGPERIAYCLEKYNGWGYRGHGVPSPYLWSGSDQYTRGKYVADGQWSSSAISGQTGGMVIYRELLNLLPELEKGDTLTEAANEFPKADKEDSASADQAIADQQAAHENLKEESASYNWLNWLRKKLGLPVAGAAGSVTMLDDPVGAMQTALGFVKTYGLELVAGAAVLIVFLESWNAVQRQKAINK